MLRRKGRPSQRTQETEEEKIFNQGSAREIGTGRRNGMRGRVVKKEKTNNEKRFKAV